MLKLKVVACAEKVMVPNTPLISNPTRLRDALIDAIYNSIDGK